MIHRRFFLSCAILVFASQSAIAQQYHWRRTLSDSWMSIAINPLSHGRVIFAGPAFVGGPGLGGGIYRSDDGGSTWAPHDSVMDPTGYSIGLVHQVFVDPGDTSVVLAATSEALFRSTDGGVTWNDLYNYDPVLHRDTLGGNNLNFGGMDDESICYNAQTNTLFYGIPPGQYSSGVWRSMDHGASWTLVRSIYFDSLIGLFSMDVSQDASPLLLQSSDTNGGNFARSTDLGNSWTFTFFGKDTGVVMEAPKIVFSWYATSPDGRHEVALAQRFEALDSATVATTDGGLTWEAINSPIHVWGLDIDQRASMISKPGNPAYPRPLHFFTGIFGVRSDTIPNGMVQETTDGGITWHSINFPKGVENDTTNPIIHEIWVMKYDTTSGRLAVSTDAGIYIGDTVASGVEPTPEMDSSIHFSQSENMVTVSSLLPLQSVRVYDVDGREIFEADPMKTTFDLNISQYPHGTYAIEVGAQGKPLFRKIIEW